MFRKPSFKILRQSATALVALIIILMLASRLPLASQQELVQEPPLYSTQLLAEMRQIQQAALASDYAYRQVAYLCNNIGPRLSGSPQAQASVEYVAAEMRRLGLEVKLEKLMVPHWVRGLRRARWSSGRDRRGRRRRKLC